MTEPRVLIVESNDALRAMLFTILRHQPVAVDTAATADDAFDKVTRCDYALIVIDMDVPSASEFLARFHEERPEATSFVLAVRDVRSDEVLHPEHVSAVLSKELDPESARRVKRCYLEDKRERLERLSRPGLDLAAG